VLAALLGLSEATSESRVEGRYEEASRLAGVPVATLKTRDGNLLLDAFARALAADAHRSWPETLPSDADRQASRTLTPARRRELENVVRASLVELSPEHGAAAWRQGVRPITGIDDDTRRLRREVSYTAGIERRRVGPKFCYQMSSSFRCLRPLPPAARLQVVFCRTTSALACEYRNPAAVSVELCDFDVGTWRDLAASRVASTLAVGAQECRRSAEDQDDEVVRVHFDVPRNGEGRLLPVTVRNTYLASDSTRVYPIMLGDYFCVGPVEMSVTLIDSKADALDAYVYFSTGGQSLDPSGEPLPRAEVERFLAPEGARQQTLRVRSWSGRTAGWTSFGAVDEARRQVSSPMGDEIEPDAASRHDDIPEPCGGGQVPHLILGDQWE
jgi:hypothetical protein